MVLINISIACTFLSFVIEENALRPLVKCELSNIGNSGNN